MSASASSPARTPASTSLKAWSRRCDESERGGSSFFSASSRPERARHLARPRSGGIVPQLRRDPPASRGDKSARFGRDDDNWGGKRAALLLPERLEVDDLRGLRVAGG